MVGIFIFVIALIVICIASLTDIKTREVPDWLSYTLIFTGFGIAAIQTIVYLNYTFLLYSAFGFGIFFSIACLMYYSGQWGGGDSKLLMGLGALVGLRLEYSMQFMILFVINLIILGAVYGFTWTLALALKNMKDFKNSYALMLKDSKVAKTRTLMITLGMLFVGLFILTFFVFNNRFAALPLLMMAMFAFLFFYVFVFSKSVEHSCMIKMYPVSKLTEGDWIAKDVLVKGKKVCGPKDLGITERQISELKKFKIKTVPVKEGIPFVPSFLIALLVTYFVGNWFLFL